MRGSAVRAVAAAADVLAYCPPFSIAQKRREEHRNAYIVMCVHIVQGKRSPAELINHISSIDQSEW